MQMEITDEKENKFFGRKDLMVKIRHDNQSTPSKADITKELAGRYSVDASQVLIDYVFTMHGIGESNAKVKILNEKPKPVEKPEAKAEGEKVEAQNGQ
jgi:ribosomal protein S24E